ncbi:hypothetical protein ES703_04104 [subsurface metagenome]
MKRVAQGFGRRLGKGERERRNARIIELFEGRLKPGPIGERVGLSAGHVRKVLRGAGYSLRQRRSND